ncbi:MAG: hypothetical protein FJ276_02810 [Planctomycetes bacterium]|nr:hypothetical protein [Planctomycetota bacterium]
MSAERRDAAKEAADSKLAVSTSLTPEFLERRRLAMAQYAEAWEGVDDLDPKGPAGHAYAVHKSAWLTQDYRRLHRKQAMSIGPQEVIDVLVAAGVKKWVLMGLHGYVGYLALPRATQDVDVMIPYSARKLAVRAVCEAWPNLIVRELSQVVRFLDPGDTGPDGKPKAVIDLMQPWGKFQETILDQHVLVDPETQHRIPTLEAALVSKYAAIVSPHRDVDKREQDAVDFRRMVRANHQRIRHDVLRGLADEVWDGAGEDIEQFVEIALSDERFPI